MAVTSATCQMVWLKRLLIDFDQQQMGATTMYCDNKATIAMTRNPALHRRTKHIDISYHYVRNLTANGEVELIFCRTNEQVADIMTKALPEAKHDYLQKKLGVCSFEARGSVN